MKSWMEITCAIVQACPLWRRSCSRSLKSSYECVLTRLCVCANVRDFALAYLQRGFGSSHGGFYLLSGSIGKNAKMKTMHVSNSTMKIRKSTRVQNQLTDQDVDSGLISNSNSLHFLSDYYLEER